MEITKREILVSISILAIMLIIGLFISSKINERNMDNNEKYYKALKVDKKDIFKYGMDTSVGNALVYGDLEAIDSVTYPEIMGDYIYIKKVKERHTPHTRTVVVRTGKTTSTRTETYWTWDIIDKEDKQSKQVELLGVNFDTSKFEIPIGEPIETIKESSNIRYKYYGFPAKSKVTIFANLKDGSIEGNNIPIYKDLNIEETIQILEKSSHLVLFWIIWSMVIVVIIYGFYYLENDWLNKY